MERVASAGVWLVITSGTACLPPLRNITNYIAGNICYMVFGVTGFANLSGLAKAVRQHKSTAGHLQTVVLLRTFREPRLDLQLWLWLLLCPWQRSFTAIKRVKRYVRNTTRHRWLMAIENDLLMEMKWRDHLYDKVIEVFLCKERTDFAHKEIIINW